MGKVKGQELEVSKNHLKEWEDDKRVKGQELEIAKSQTQEWED
jgi:hypothetical protein